MEPQVGYQKTTVSGPGTVALTDRSTALVRIVIPGTYTGTINFHDAATTTGTTATSQIFSLGIPNTSVGASMEIGANCKKGLVYQASGTPAMTIVWN